MLIKKADFLRKKVQQEKDRKEREDVKSNPKRKL